MDPGKALADIRAICEDPLYIDRVWELRDLIEGLDEWITKGGYRPSDWQKRRPYRPASPRPAERTIGGLATPMTGSG